MGAKSRPALPNDKLGIGLFARMIAGLCRRHGNESPFGGRAAATLGALCGLLAWQSALAFNFEDVAQRARQLAAASFKPQESKLPSEIEKLNYDEFRDIRFKPARSLWRSDRLPFEIAFFHEGLFFKQPV